MYPTDRPTLTTLRFSQEDHSVYRMPVSPETLIARIRGAMTDAGLSQQSLAQAIGLDPTALSKALSGNRNFKSLEVALIAEQLGVSVQSLLSEAAMPTVLVAARAQPSANLAVDQALAKTHSHVELDALLSDLGLGWTASLDAGDRLTGSDFRQGEELGTRVRAAMSLPGDDLPYDLPSLASLLERRLGVDVGFEPLPEGFDGLSVSRDGFRLALVSSGISATRQRFTLAHEIGHLAAGDSQDLHVDESVFGRKAPDETRANAFAASFLMPAQAIRDAVPHGFVSEEIVAALLGRFGVSLDALAFRLHNIGVVDAVGRDRVRSMSSNRIVLRNGRASDLQARGDRRVPGNLLQRTIEAYTQAKISIRPLATLLSVPAEKLLAELSPARTYPSAGEADPKEPAL
jgi:Zn-dependent peptidase ImmA (M78 family)/lambda repressor-like predicted transcriptional regulator